MKKRRIIVIICAVIVCAVTVTAAVLHMRGKAEHNYTLYVGGYGDHASKYSFNSRTLEITKLADFDEANPSFITLNPSGSVLYAVSENGNKSGVSAFKNSFTPTKLNRRTDIGSGPCYITFYKDYVLTANYGGGSISLFPTDTAGLLKPHSQIIRFIGSGPVSGRQASSHIHTVRIIKGKDSGNDYVMATDLGCDKLYFFRFSLDKDKAFHSEESGKPLKLFWCDSTKRNVPAGYGPRHVEFSPDGKNMYLLCEISGRILVYTISEKENNLILNKIQDTLSDRMNASASADIHIHPNGKFLYASCRKVRDGISIFAVHSDGTLSKKGYQITGRGPRNFAITPDGDYLLVACQLDRRIQIFKINNKTGFLTNTDKTLELNNLEPSCIIIR